MQFQRTLGLLAALSFVGAGASPQQADNLASNVPVIRSETRLVLVDAVVTDRKGNCVRDLASRDFRVWEDDKEQPIQSFSFEEEPVSQLGGRPRYLVLFFDNSTMNSADQRYAREAAAKFIETNAGPNRLMAIANFAGALRISQNFTADVERLKKVASGVKAAGVASATLGTPSLGGAETDFGARSALLALGSLAKKLAAIPGRKSIIFLSGGIPLNDQTRSEATAVLNACNRAYVAVYSVDVRGMVVDGPSATGALSMPAPVRSGPGVFAYAGAASSFRAPRMAFMRQGRPAGGDGGNTGGGAGEAAPVPRASAKATGNQSRFIVPEFKRGTTSNQEVLYALAHGTGGFVVLDTNDLVGGLDKIGREQNQYYLLGYTAPEMAEGSCHTLKVKVNRNGVNVRARSGYCDVKPVDLLAGKPIEKELEFRAAAAEPGNVAASMTVPFFYTSANTARVDVALEIPSASIKFEKSRGGFHAALNILGIAYRGDGGVAARFSDTMNLDFGDKKAMEAFAKRPLQYDDQFEIASGSYQLKVVFSSGNEMFGKVEAPLVIDAHDGKQFSLSGIALTKDVRPLADVGLSMDAALLEGKTPLVSRGLQFMPIGKPLFKKEEPSALYVEIYAPSLLEPNPPSVGIHVRVVDRKSGEQKQDSGIVDIASHIQPGSSVVPIGFKLVSAPLAAGSYRAEVKAVDSLGRATAIRSADFELE